MEEIGAYRRLIEKLVEKRHLKSPRIIEAFYRSPRHFFVEDHLSCQAAEDRPLPIPAGQAISQPTTVAIKMELLSVSEGDNVLEIGSGSGWQTTIIGNLVGEAGLVVSFERITEVCNFSRKNIESAGLSQLPIKLIKGDASKISSGLYDKIISGASSKAVPENWKKILKIGGRMIVPVGDCLLVADKLSADDFNIRRYFGFNFVPLISGSGKKA